MNIFGWFKQRRNGPKHLGRTVVVHKSSTAPDKKAPLPGSKLVPPTLGCIKAKVSGGDSCNMSWDD